MFEVPKIVRTFGTVSGITEQPTGLDLGLQNASIKSIQSGSTPGGVVTINAVDPNKAIARMRGYRGLNDYYCYLSSATQLMTVTGSARQWEVIEFISNFCHLKLVKVRRVHRFSLPHQRVLLLFTLHLQLLYAQIKFGFLVGVFLLRNETLF